MDTDVASKPPVESVFEPQLIKPVSDDAGSFANAKVVGVVDPLVLRKVCHMQYKACFSLAGRIRVGI